MRVFTAFSLNDELTAKLKTAADSISDRLIDLNNSRVKPLEQSQLHITISFHAELDGQGLQDLLYILSDTLGSLKVIEFSFDKISFFESRSGVRIIWAGSSNPPSLLIETVNQFVSTLRDFDLFDEATSFIPHSTLVRCKVPVTKQHALSAIEAANWESVTCLLDKVSVYSSKLTPAGPEYEVLQELNLNGISI